MAVRFPAGRLLSVVQMSEWRKMTWRTYAIAGAAVVLLHTLGLPVILGMARADRDALIAILFTTGAVLTLVGLGIWFFTRGAGGPVLRDCGRHPLLGSRSFRGFFLFLPAALISLVTCMELIEWI